MSKYPGVKVWLQEVSLGPDAKDHMPSSEYTGKGPDANGPVAIGLITKGSSDGPTAKCMNAKGPGCMESVCKKSGFKSCPKKVQMRKVWILILHRKK